MGLYDRPYAMDGGESSGGRPLGMMSMNRWSVNTWIIVVNSAIFLLGLVFAVSPVPMLIKSPKLDVAPNSYTVLPQYIDVNGSVADPKTLRTPGAIVYRTIADKNTGLTPLDPATQRPVVAGVYQLVDPLFAYGHFSLQKGVGELQVWRLVTFQFLHGGAMHLIFNMFGLFVFGGIVEEWLGRKKYLAYYLTCGIFGGLSYLLLSLLGMLVYQGFKLQIKLPVLLIEHPSTPLVGASAGVFGVIVAAAFIRPKDQVQLLLPPVTLTMRTLAYTYVAIAFINLFFGGQNAGGDAAHIGGALAGYFFIRRSHLLTDFFDVFGDSRRPKKPRAKAPPAAPVGLSAKEEAELDRILAKVATQGLGALTDAEKRSLAAETDRRRGR
jgi:membrane associated rhomboid family serine protease